MSSRLAMEGSDGGLSRAETLLIAAVTFLALLLRLVDLARFELWIDEATTWWLAGRLVEGGFGEPILLEPTPPLYFALVGLWTRLAGESELALRLPSLLFGTAAVPVLYAFGRALCGRHVAALAAVLLAVHPLAVFYSREARVYPLVLLLTLLAFHSLWRATESGGRCWWLAFGASLLALCYSHGMGLFVLAAAGLGVLILVPPGEGSALARRRNGLLAAAGAGLLYLPYLLVTYPQLADSGATWPVEQFFRQFPEEGALGRVLELQLVGATYHPHLRQLARPPTPVLLGLLLLVVQVALLLAAVVGAWRQERLRPLGFLFLAWLLPTLLPWGVSRWLRPVALPGRHDVHTVGFLCLLLAVGLVTLGRAPGSARRGGRRAAVLVASLALLLGAGHRLLALHRSPPSADHGERGRWLALHARPGDLAVATGVRRLITEYYTRRSGGELPFESFPRETDAHPGYADPFALLEDEARLRREAAAQAGSLAERVADGGTLWVVAQRYRVGGGVSLQWQVDRHLFAALEAAGWRPTEEARSRAGEPLFVTGFRRPVHDG